mgnify:CR=1 FL=1|tara:strand:- start:4737 stop:5087 length:351 start_codon:yes stop_codon:yes gene_type:complete
MDNTPKKVDMTNVEKKTIYDAVSSALNDYYVNDEITNTLKYAIIKSMEDSGIKEKIASDLYDVIVADNRDDEHSDEEQSEATSDIGDYDELAMRAAQSGYLSRDGGVYEISEEHSG